MKIPKQALVLDCSNLCYRVYFCNREKDILDAVISYVKFLVSKYKMPAMWVFDKGRPQRRMELLPSYKGNRQITEEVVHIKNQIFRLRKFIKECNMPVFIKEDHEADDIIATICHNLFEESIICSNDKDMYQLLNDVGPWPLVHVFKKEELYTRSDFVEEWGMEPETFPLFRSFVGDSSDNINGVHRIGEKKALQVIQEYGESADVILSNCQDNKSKDIRGISDQQDILFRNLELITLDTQDIPLYLEMREGLKNLHFDVTKIPDILMKNDLMTEDILIDNLLYVAEFYEN